MRRTLWALALVAVTGLVVSTGCRDDDNDNNSNVNGNGNTNTNTGDHTIYQIQDPAHPAHLQPGYTVAVERVVVTAVDRFDSGNGRVGNVWVQEPDGGPYSGIMVFNPSILPGGTLDDIQVGDLVDVTGEIVEFPEGGDTTGRSVTEISYGAVTVLGQTDPIVPEALSAQALMGDPDAEQWEGVLVRATNARVTAQEDSGSYKKVTFTGGLVAEDDLWDVYAGTTLDTCYASVAGVLHYTYGYFLLPREAGDLVEGNPTDCATATGEICDDGVDNDGDTFVDCADWDCEGDPACQETDCGDGVDNDNDGFTDCEDNDCIGTVDCPAQVENDDTLCADGVDNDGDNAVDCEDPSCNGNPNVTVCTETDCSDNVDNDLDGHVDCEDYDCLAAGACDSNPSVEAGAAACSDGVDNDGNGFVDCADNSCRYSVAACQEDTPAACTDGVDNDDDGYTDCDDFSCIYAGLCPDTEVTEADCSDGVDNDGNGFTDCDDYSCRFSELVTSACEGNAVTCADGLDNDGNGFTDCSDYSCRCCPGEGDACFSERVADTCARCTQ